MPVETVIVLGAVMAAFTFYGIVLAVVSHETDVLLRQKEKAR